MTGMFPTRRREFKFTKKFSAGLLGGEGFILQDISGTGMVFLEIDGDKVEKNLMPGEGLFLTKLTGPGKVILQT